MSFCGLKSSSDFSPHSNLNSLLGLQSPAWSGPSVLDAFSLARVSLATLAFFWLLERSSASYVESWCLLAGPALQRSPPDHFMAGLFLSFRRQHLLERPFPTAPPTVALSP